MLDISSYTFCVTVSSDDAGMKNAMNSTPTEPSENAMGMPENMISKVTTPNSVPSAIIDISGLPSAC